MLEALERGVRSWVPTMALGPALLLRSHEPRDRWGPARPSGFPWWLCQPVEPWPHHLQLP